MNVTKFLQVRQLNETIDPLLDDMDRCASEVMKAHQAGTIDQFWSRALIRAFFVVVEALTYQLRTMVQAAAAAGAFALSEHESAAMAEVAYDLNAQGRVVSRPRFIATERHLRFVFGLAMRMVGVDYTLPVSDVRFAHFKTALAVRNRLTHPKRPSDVAVTAAEIEATRAAILWYNETHQELVRRWQHRLAEVIYEAKEDRDA